MWWCHNPPPQGLRQWGLSSIMATSLRTPYGLLCRWLRQWYALVSRSSTSDVFAFASAWLWQVSTLYKVSLIRFEELVTCLTVRSCVSDQGITLQPDILFALRASGKWSTICETPSVVLKEFFEAGLAEAEDIAIAELANKVSLPESQVNIQYFAFSINYNNLWNWYRQL